MSRPIPWTTDRHDCFFSDAYRTVANIGLDYEWFGTDVGQCKAAERQQSFLLEDLRKDSFSVYEVDGTLVENGVLHPVAIIATTAQSALAAWNDTSKEWDERFWNTPLRMGERRYYDNWLYMFAMLALSGEYRIW